jgi:hypothetical protein
MVRRNLPGASRSRNPDGELEVPAPAGCQTEPCAERLNLPMEVARRGRPEVGLRVVVVLPRKNLRRPTGENQRLTLELSGHINREAIDWSA